jgi:hypothetical protein
MGNRPSMACHEKTITFDGAKLFQMLANDLTKDNNIENNGENYFTKKNG